MGFFSVGLGAKCNHILHAINNSESTHPDIMEEGGNGEPACCWRGTGLTASPEPPMLVSGVVGSRVRLLLF